MLQGNEAEGADTLFEGKGTKNNRDFQISRKIFQSVIGKNSVLLFILSTQFLGNFQRLSDLLHQDFTRRKFRHVLGDLDSRLVELEKFDLFPIYQKTTLSDRTLQLRIFYRKNLYYMRPCQLGRKLRHNLFFWYLSDACEIRRHLCAIRYLIQGWSQEVETCNPSSRNSSHKLPQIWLSLRPPIFNSQIHTDGA